MRFRRVAPVAQDVTPPGAGPRLPPLERARAVAAEVSAGLVASVVLIANIVSFGALMFPGPLADGAPVAVWAMLIGSSIVGVVVAMRTSLPPMATGMDSATGAAMVLLSATVGAASFLDPATPQPVVVLAVLMCFSAATLVSGAVMLALGALRWGRYFRFVPYFVVGGFLAATGWLLIAGGVRMATGRDWPLGSVLADWRWEATAKLGCAIAVMLLAMALKRWVRSPYALPVLLLLLWAVGGAVLRALGLNEVADGWYLPSIGTLLPWEPFVAWPSMPFDRSHLPELAAQMLAVTVVSLIALVSKVSSLEVTRQSAGDLDREFSSHGVANLLATPLGGFAGGLQLGSSTLLMQAGGRRRLGGVVCALALGAVGLSNFDLPGMIPKPIVAGLVLYLGWNFIAESLGKLVTQRSWFDLVLSLAIAVACVRLGYPAGVLGGVVGACLLFALSYARVGVVRQHVSRARFASDVSRPESDTRYLQAHGEAIQLYWLSGYIFFGSSEGLFERVRADIAALPAGRVRHVVLDFRLVSGADASASGSLIKLRNECQRRDVTIAYASLSPRTARLLRRAGLFGGQSRHHSFTDLHLALAWCEQQLLQQAGLGAEPGLDGFTPWLQGQLGAAVRVDELMAYLVRRDLPGSQCLYRQGEPADSVDLVAAGRLVVDLVGADGGRLRVRTLLGHTVVGEMGFVRRAMRTAEVSSDGPTTLYTLTRENLERLRRERPELAMAFDDFILRVLAERVNFSDQLVLALGVR